MFKKWWTFNLITEYNIRKFTISDIKNTESILCLYRSLKIANDDQVVYIYTYIHTNGSQFKKKHFACQVER